VKERGKTQTLFCKDFCSFQAGFAYSIEVSLVLRFIQSFILVTIVCLFAMIAY